MKDLDGSIGARGENAIFSPGRVLLATEVLLQILQQRFKAIPDDARTAILDTKDRDQLTSWIRLSIATRTLGSFRNNGGV